MPSACGVARASALKCFAIPDKEQQGGKIRQHCRSRACTWVAGKREENKGRVKNNPQLSCW
eukprot:4918162-Heterocapsa_arctica.AAC.1